MGSLRDKIQQSLEKGLDKDTFREMTSHAVPAKRSTRLRTPITRGSPAQFGRLVGVPGGSWFDMAHAKTTGTVTLSHERDRALTQDKSAKNCYTTKSATHHFGA